MPRWRRSRATQGSRRPRTARHATLTREPSTPPASRAVASLAVLEGGGGNEHVVEGLRGQMVRGGPAGRLGPARGRALLPAVVDGRRWPMARGRTAGRLGPGRGRALLPAASTASGTG